jgi:hypothetical protein
MKEYLPNLVYISIVTARDLVIGNLNDLQIWLAAVKN